jgi:acetylornithine deacetylase/succinyl-diaminopimelate desuccinylase-like protein
MNVPAAARAAIAALALLANGPADAAEGLRPDRQAFRALYRELVETDTTLSHGNCTLAASRMAVRLKAAGLPEAQVAPFSVPDHPQEGGLLAVIPGRDPKLKAVLLLAHLDVVEARREDWVRDPFTLVEEGGYFYARGTLDDKAMAAVWTDTMARLAAAPKPRRTVKLALTCGEETDGAFNGAQWLASNRREQIDAAFALNEGGGGLSDGHGKLQALSVQVGEKAYVDFALVSTNRGGHSSQPVRDNAIYAMGDALARLRDLEFPLEFNETTRAFFETAGRIKGGAIGSAMIALAANPADKAAEAAVNGDKLYHSLLRTTCVPTMISGGHAKNALPQRVTVNVNCRMFPGRTIAETQARLAEAIADPAIAIRPARLDKPVAGVPPMDPAVLGPMRRLAERHFPGVPVVPTMSTGATDGVYMSAAEIPTYGVPGLWTDPDGNGMHGLNERIAVRALMEGRDYLFDLVHAYID